MTVDAAAANDDGGLVGVAPLIDEPVPADGGNAAPAADPAQTPTAPAGESPADAAPAQATPDTPATQSIYERMGLPAERFQGMGEEDALRAIGQAATEAEQLRQRQRELEGYAQLGARVAPYNAEFQQFLQSLRQPQAAQPQAPGAAQQTAAEWWAEHWKPPQFDEKLIRYWTRQNPETGELDWDPNTPAEVKQGAIEWRQHREETLNSILNNPLKWLYENPAMQKFREDLLSEIQQTTQATIGSRELEHQIQSYERQNAAWMYELGPDGRAAQDPITGAVRYTPQGNFFVEHIRADQEDGIRDPAVLLRRAHTALKRELAYYQQLSGGGAAPAAAPAAAPVAPAAPPATPAQVQAAANSDYLKTHNRSGATHAPSHNGTPPGLHAGESPLPGNSREALLERLRQAIPAGTEI